MIVALTVQDRPDLVLRRSDQGFLIRQDQTGNLYGEAIDLIESPYTYTETNIPANDEQVEIHENNSYKVEIADLKAQDEILLECILEMSEEIYN